MTSTNRSTPMRDPERTAGGDGADTVAVDYPGPFRCPVCERIDAVAHSFVEHLRRHNVEPSFACGRCRRMFPTIHGVATHHSKCGRTVRRRRPSECQKEDEPPLRFVCPECGAAFSKATGLQLHRRSAHIQEFMSERPRELRKRWSEFEKHALAALEAKLPESVYNVNQVLSQQLFEEHGLTRNVEMIKGQRRLESYKRLVLSLRSEALEASAAPGVSGSAAGFTGQQALSAEAEQHEQVLPVSADFDLSTAHTAPGLQSASSLHDAVLPFLSELACLQAEEGSLQHALQMLAQRAVQGESILNDTVLPVLSSIDPPPRRSRTALRRPPAATATSNRKRKQARFRQLRRLYNQNKNRLAEVVLDGAGADTHDVPLETCYEFYLKAFGTESPADDEAVNLKPRATVFGEPRETLFQPIQINEIITALAKIPRKSAPGPDNVTVDHVRSLKPVELQILLNIWLFYRDVPESFKQCRTVLIPKKIPARGPADYRPITIASVFYRLFTKIVSSRLSWSAEL
ncbi:hypothetical protein M514_28375, partial [Trichuris suis]